MPAVRVYGDAIPNLPWQDKPKGSRAPIWRFDGNPIIERDPIPSAARVYNSAVLPYGGGFIGVFRGDHHNGIPRLHVGTSRDGLSWDIRDESIRFTDEAGQPYDSLYEYDPRLTKIGDAYYIVWCTDCSGPTLGLAETRDFESFTRLENPFFPFNRNGVLFPRRVNGRYLLLSRPSDNGHTAFGDIYLSESPDLHYWGGHRKVMGTGGLNWWQCTKVGAGSVPIETERGWLLFYHGVVQTCNGYVYSIGACLLDRERPARVLYRSRDALLSPRAPYETTEHVPNVCFPSAALCDADTGRIALYYGAADTVLAAAFTTVDEILRYLEENSELGWGDDQELR